MLLVSIDPIYCVLQCLFKIFIIAVPYPTVIVTTPKNHTVGQSLTLYCEATIARGITAKVDIVWLSNGRAFLRISDITASTVNNLLVYSDSFTLKQLDTTENGRVIGCEVVIHTNPPIMASSNIILDVIGEYK